MPGRSRPRPSCSCTVSRTLPAATNAALKFFAWAFAKGGKMAEELDYVPMPANVVGAVQKVWATQIKDPAGKPVYAISR